MTPLEIARCDILAVDRMRELNKDGLPIWTVNGDTPRRAVVRWINGGRSGEWQAWRAMHWADQELQLRHERAALALLAVKARVRVWLLGLGVAA